MPGSQKAKKDNIKKNIENSLLWSPQEDWVFNVYEIPSDQNLDDFTVGSLELAREQGTVTKKYLEKTFPLVYTEAGVVRKNRKQGGRPFIGPDGNAVLLSDGTPLRGKGMLKAGVWAVNTVRKATGFGAWMDRVFNDFPDEDPPPSLHYGKGLKRSRAEGSRACASSYSSSRSSSTDNEQDGDPKRRRTSKVGFSSKHQKLFDFAKGLDKKTKGQKIVTYEDVKDLKEKIAGLQQKIQKAVPRATAMQELLDESIQKQAMNSAKVINHVIHDAVECADDLEDKCDGGRTFYLAWFQQALEDSLKYIKEVRGYHSLPRDDKRPHIGTLRTDQETKEELDAARNAVLKEIDSTREAKLEKEKAKIRAELMIQEAWDIHDW